MEDSCIRDKMNYAHTLWSMTVHGGDIPWHNALRSRMETPLVGDTVLEMSTFHHKVRSGDLSGYGWLADRLYDTSLSERKEDPIPPEQQNWRRDWLWVVHSEATNERHNWGNADFIYAFDWSSFNSFRRASQGDLMMFREHNFNPLDRKTWWWLDRAAAEERMYRARAAAALAGTSPA